MKTGIVVGVLVLTGLASGAWAQPQGIGVPMGSSQAGVAVRVAWELSRLHAHLGVNPSQEEAWQRYVQAMQALAAVESEPRQPPPAGTRPDRLAQAERHLGRQEARLAAQRGVLEAFKGLHAQLDARQKAVAEQLPNLLGCGGK